jgi:hypothetical protein
LGAAPKRRPPKANLHMDLGGAQVRQTRRGVYIAGGGGCPAGSHRARYVCRVVEGVMGGIFFKNLQARFLHTQID